MSAHDDEAFECSEGDVGGCLCIADGCRDECVVCWPIEVSEDQSAFDFIADAMSHGESGGMAPPPEGHYYGDACPPNGHGVYWTPESAKQEER